MIPSIDGELHTFTDQGLCGGLFLMYDHESGSHWNHVAGEAVRGAPTGATRALQRSCDPTAYALMAELTERADPTRFVDPDQGG